MPKTLFVDRLAKKPAKFGRGKRADSIRKHEREQKAKRAARAAKKKKVAGPSYKAVGRVRVPILKKKKLYLADNDTDTTEETEETEAGATDDDAIERIKENERKKKKMLEEAAG